LTITVIYTFSLSKNKTLLADSRMAV